MSRTRPEASFENFDDADVFPRYKTAVCDVESQNFVLDFDGAKAECAFNLEDGDIEALLARRRIQLKNDEKVPTRWINIWQPETQKRLVQRIAHHYGFSPRLLSSMCCGPLKPQPVDSHGPQHRTMHEMIQRIPKRGKVSDAYTKEDIESHEMAKTPTYSPGVLDLNHYRIVDEVWHFASVDWGYRFTCIGFNSLYRSLETIVDESQMESNRPAGRRVWMWLILCDDNTVISIHENPFPNPADATPKEVESIRHNLVNVFKQLSTAADANQPQNPIMTVHIRPKLHNTTDNTDLHVSDEDGPSLLFYYLFDDWFTSYSLVARSEHQYSAHLERVRESMFEAADLKNARQLHHFGRQLAVLKRIYQSYSLIIERLLNGPQGSRKGIPAASNTRRLSQFASPLDTTISDQALNEVGTAYGVPISLAAAVRFERLQDRIGLYAMSEIQDCLDEKEALVMLNFNLIALKESSYVERLTRITILLAKVTILFLPVSLMSAYFAVPLVDVAEHYTVLIYWVCFGVVFTLSLLLLIVFGQLSGTQEGKPIYRSLTRAGYEWWRNFFGFEESKKKTKKG